MGGGEEEEGDNDEAEKDEEKDEEEETEKKKNRARYTATPVACGVRVGSGRINHRISKITMSFGALQPPMQTMENPFLVFTATERC